MQDGAYRRRIILRHTALIIFLLCFTLSARANLMDFEMEEYEKEEIDSLLVEIKKVDDATESARNAVDAFSDSLFLPQLLFQLSEWELRREKLHFNLDLLKYDKLLTLHERDSTEFPEPEEPLLTYEATLDINKRILAEFSDVPFIDRVKYRTAICLYETGVRDTALTYFLELIQEYPDSLNTPEINFRVGECYFDHLEFETALDWYDKVLEFFDSPYFAMALYKRAWCYYRLNDYYNSISSFFYLLKDIKLLEEVECELIGKTQSELIDEALEYISISFTDYANVDLVLDFTRDTGCAEFVPDIFAAMGNVYFRRDFYDEAISVSMKVLKEYPLSSAAPQAQYNLFNSYEKINNYEKALRVRETFERSYRPGSKWALQNSEECDSLNVSSLLSSMDYVIATPYLNRADSLFSISSYTRASHAYRNFLKAFPDDARADNAAYYLAECLYELENYNKAALAYNYVTTHFPMSELAEDAGYNRIVCYDMLDKTLHRSEPDTMKWKSISLALNSKTERKIIESCTDFILQFRDTDRAVEIQLKLADMFLRLENNMLAEAMLTDVIKAIYKYRRGKQYGAQALHFMAYATFKQNKFDSAEKYFVYLMRQYPDSTEMIESSKTMLASSRYKVAESLKESGNAYRAARKFEQTALNASDEQVAEAALFESALQFKNAEKLVKAAINFEKFSRRFPQSDRYEEALYQSAMIREQLSHWHLAARNYMEIYKHDPGSPKGASALFAAGISFEKAKNWYSMSSTFDEFLTKYPNDEQRYLEALFKTGYAREQRAQFHDAYAIYNKVITEFENKIRNNEYADEYIAAQTHFRIGELMHLDFSAIKLKPPFEVNMQRKQKMFNRMMKQLVDVTRYNVAEWTTASFYTIGHCYEEFCQDILNSPTPAELTQDQVQQYWDMIHQKWITPLQKEALRYYATNQKLAIKNSVENKWVKHTKERISFLKEKLFTSNVNKDENKMRPAVDTVDHEVKMKRKNM